VKTVGLQSITYGNLDELDDITPEMRDIDVIVHCAGRAHVLREKSVDPLRAFLKTNRDATLRLAQQASAAGVKRFVFISSIGVLGNQTYGQPFRADTPPAPHVPYAESKLQAEQGLASIAEQTGLEVVIIRPPLILGPNPIGNLGTLMTAIRKGLPLPFGLVTQNRRSLARVETVADLIAIAAIHPDAPGRVFLVADEPALSTKDIAVALAAIEDRCVRFLPVPGIVLITILNALGKGSLANQLLGDLELDITYTKSVLNCTPPVFIKS
jgi:nucleoside-diphosphate-sugar epimerase